MKKDWTIRTEIYKAFHQWPSLIVFFAIGCLIGWGLSLILPASYRSTAQIYIGLNPYRAFSDTIFLALAQPKYGNVDDYKNWQMTQLESVIYLPEFIDSTLAALQAQDSYWSDIDSNDLSAMLTADWRSAGTWDLNAEHPLDQRAEQAATAWSEITLEKVEDAIQASRTTFMIDQELQEVVSERVQTEKRWTALTSTHSALATWLSSHPLETNDQQLSHSEREGIYALVAQVAEFTPVWNNLLNTFPPTDSGLKEYQLWVEQSLTTIDAELPILENRIASLQEQHAILQNEYDQAAHASKGLSPNLTIEGIDHLPARIIRSGSQFMLLGGIIAIFVWIFVQIMRVARKEYEQ